MNSGVAVIILIRLYFIIGMLENFLDKISRLIF